MKRLTKEDISKKYIHIAGWMISELGLTGNNLIIYAIIYGFSQDGESVFEGSYNYISDLTGLTKATVIRCVNHLTEMKLIEKIENPKCKNSYRATNKSGIETIPGIKTIPGIETIQGGYQNDTTFNPLPSPIPPTIPIDNNLINNKLFPPIVSDNKLSSTIDPHGGKTSKFVKPSLDELKAFCLDNTLEYLDPEEFIDFYESKGWKVGSSPMKDWKAAARRWNRNNSQRTGAKKVLMAQPTNQYPDGTYRRENFKDTKTILDEFRFDGELRRRILQGYSVKRINGKWTI